jgi:hypothetical protein
VLFVAMKCHTNSRNRYDGIGCRVYVPSIVSSFKYSKQFQAYVSGIVSNVTYLVQLCYEAQIA